jgi:glyoxylase-like metal-dependent hydrolase (beta-lactamase superfamily II)
MQPRHFWYAFTLKSAHDEAFGQVIRPRPRPRQSACAGGRLCGVHPRISRRRLLIDVGRGTVAVVLLGAAACGNDPAEPAAPAGGASPSSGPPPAGTADWTRVDLGFVAAYVLVRGREAAVVDTGTPGSADAIGESLRGAGSSWSAVRHVVLTHYHDDHAGGVADVMRQAGAATGYAGEADLPRIDGPRPMEVAADDAEIFGLQVVATPGHTAGHICLFDPATGVLVAGDALNNTAGLAGSNPQFTADEGQARESVRKLAALPVRTIYVGHGDAVQEGAAEALRRLARSG